MRTSARWRAAAVVAAVASLAVAGCGGSSSDSSSGGGNQSTTPPQGAKKGGDLTVLYNADVDNIDPGIAYYQYSFNHHGGETWGGGHWRHFNHHQDKKVYHVVKYRYWDGHGWSDWYKDMSHKTDFGH